MGDTTPRTPDIVDMEPITAPDGSELWVAADDAIGTETPPDPDGLQVGSGMVRAERSQQSLTTLPREVLAGGQDWNQIVTAITAAERGSSNDVEVAVTPGGHLEIKNADSSTNGLSTVPREILAAGGRATASDLSEARAQDPANVEDWRFIDDPRIPGLQFAMAPAGRRFDFFCVRSPMHGGRWLLTVLSPNLDALLGHENHMITASIGGERIPVVCGPGDSTYASLAQVRGVAAKFALYHTLRAHGHVAFSA